MKEKDDTYSECMDALVKKAVGFDATETVEEFLLTDDGEIRLAKKKVTTKNVPPDVAAIKILIGDETPLSDMTDEELEEEKNRLLKLLKESEKGGVN